MGLGCVYWITLFINIMKNKMEVSFYHLQKTSVEKALPKLLEKALESGLRAVVLADTAQIQNLNESMWTFRPDGFVPHATSAEGRAKDNPVWLTDTIENPNQATMLVTTHNRIPELSDDFSKYIYFFNGLDEAELKQARQLWKDFKNHSGASLRYFQQTDKGAWEEKQLN